MRLYTCFTTISAAALGIGLMAGNASAANDLLIEQQAPAGNSQNSANFANGTQEGSGHETYIGQRNGSGVSANSASGKIGGGQNNQVDIEQTSNRNVVSVFGIGDGNNNTLVVRQGGDIANYASFDMASGSNNTFGAIQRGFDNAVTSGGGTTLGAPFSNTVPAVSTQGTVGTFANTNQAQVGGGDNNFGLVAQIGDRNVLALHQRGFDNVIVGKSATEPVPTLDGGNAPSGFFSNPNITAPATASGSIPDGNAGGLGTQAGDNNVAALLQDGTGNEISFLQSGSGHTAEVRQVGGSNQAVAVQTN